MRKYICFTIILFLYLTGCSPLTMVPVTLKEVKDYVAGQTESFSYPIDQVLSSAIMVLKKTGFEIRIIQHFNDKGLIEAQWKDTKAIFTLNQVTPLLTKVVSKVQSEGNSREHSSEKELFEQTKKILEDGQTIGWKKLAEGMVPVLHEFENDSPVLGYLGNGTTIKISKVNETWGTISLLDGVKGYVLLKYLQ